MAAAAAAGGAAEVENITIVSAEGERFTVPKKVAEMAGLVKMMVEDSDANEDVPLSDVKSAVLAKVIEFCKHHVDQRLPEIEKPLRSNNLAEIVPEWDAKFVDIEQEVLFELILAANYMDIKSLLDLTCAKVASMIKGKTPEQIRKTFNIRNDFTPEEEAQIIEENKWCEEV